MNLTFLGTGAAVSPDAYNAAILVDRTILLDAGAPLSVHLPKAGLSLDEPRAVFLTHFHADHTFGLAWLILGRILMHEQAAPLTIFGPPGTRAHVTQLMELAWGPEMLHTAMERRQMQVEEIAPGQDFHAEGYRVRAYPMVHAHRFSCFGYLLTRTGVRLGYTGDAEMSAELEALIAASDHTIVEMTYEMPGPMHLSKPEVESLISRHPGVRFILTHRGTRATIKGAVAAHDFLTLRLPLR
ncbi:MAG TPA: MBL fold metallo-hydrolase [Candidatus Dormibacteraeota bacterium]